MRHLLRLGTALSVSGVAACAAIWGFQDLLPANPPDASTDTPMMLDSGIKPSCDVDHPPPPPDAADLTAGQPFVLAVDTIDLGVSALADGGSSLSATRYGFDLDNVCTCNQPDQESCVRPNKDDPQTCDDDRGRDDTGRSLLLTLQPFLNTSAFTNEGATAQIKKGRMTTLIGVQGYNGTPNDPSVVVSVVPSIGLEGDGGAPTFTMADKWVYDKDLGGKLAPNNLVGTMPNKPSRTAYVNNGTLVATFDDIYLLLQFDVTNGNPLPVHITDAVTTAKISANGNSWQLDEGRLSGRWATGDLLRAVGVWELTGTLSGPICPGNDLVYGTVKNIVCKGRDIAARAGRSPNSPCDAISFGIGFTAKPASAGSPGKYPYKTTSCFDGVVKTMLDNYPDDCK